MIDRRTVLAGTAGLGLAALLGCSRDDPPRPPAATGPVPSPTTTTEGPINPRVDATIATGLTVPWGIAFLPDGGALVSERDTGAIVRVGADGTSEPFGEVPGVDTGGSEGGLLGLALDPADENVLFAQFTSPSDDRVVRFDISGGVLGEGVPILTGIPRDRTHHGGRLLFDAEGYLMVGTGDGQQVERAQDLDSPLGKILRIDTEGRPAPGNPFDTMVWSYGHRNVQGLAFDADGRFWATEFGANDADELNLIEPGGNYGWPQVEGTGGTGDLIDPKVTWAPADCSPSGLAIARSTAFVAALRGRSLWAVPLDGENVGEPQRLFEGEFGRIRTVTVAPDDSLWIATSNTDGRGDPIPEDDRILRVVL